MHRFAVIRDSVQANVGFCTNGERVLATRSGPRNQNDLNDGFPGVPVVRVSIHVTRLSGYRRIWTEERILRRSNRLYGANCSRSYRADASPSSVRSAGTATRRSDAYRAIVQKWLESSAPPSGTITSRTRLCSRAGVDVPYRRRSGSRCDVLGARHCLTGENELHKRFLTDFYQGGA